LFIWIDAAPSFYLFAERNGDDSKLGADVNCVVDVLML